MRLKIIAGVFGSLFLVGLLVASIYVVQQNQDIRQRAANDVEFMQVTPADRRRGGKAEVSVVLNKLDPKFEYRLIFDLKYEKNSQVSTDVSLPKSIKKPEKSKKIKPTNSSSVPTPAATSKSWIFSSIIASLKKFGSRLTRQLPKAIPKWNLPVQSRLSEAPPLPLQFRLPKTHRVNQPNLSPPHPRLNLRHRRKSPPRLMRA